MSGLNALIQLLTALLELFKKNQAKKKQEERQNDRQKIEDDPTGWLNDHFNGLPDDAKKNGNTETNKAND